MAAELGLDVGSRYSIALLVFFITYFLFEIPSNIVLRKVGAANWLAFLCFAWGVVTLGIWPNSVPTRPTLLTVV